MTKGEFKGRKERPGRGPAAPA